MIRALTTLLLSVMLSSCISYRSETDVQHQAVSDPDLLNSIQLGETTSGWLLEHLGKPDAIRRPADTAYVWQYENVQASHRSIRAMPLLAIQTKRMARVVYSFEVENDRIVKYWKESLSR